ncbi:MAG TPA: hypothetical protein DCM04_05765 [Saprospirales bacterium]|nr:hypothetical protein [Saprospirales bacterium]|tara:strand:- start:28 stop:837 length:810 start_codon:yes stop_codon:yes gene_type:complete
MKKYIYSFMLIAAGAALLSNSAGRGTVSGQGAAGAPGDGLTCASSNCHGSAGPFAVDLQIVLVKDGEEVTEYRPGETYSMFIAVEATVGSPTRYGFQMTVVTDADNSGAGSLSDVSSNAKSLTLNGRTYLEHNGPSNLDEFSALWTSPEAGTGDVTVFAAGIAANGNGGTSGDTGVIGSMTFKEMDLSNIKVLTEDEMSFSPNPTMDIIKIDTKLNQHMVYDVISIDGMKMASGIVANNAIDMSNLLNGMYIVSVRGEGFIYRQKIYKI